VVFTRTKRRAKTLTRQLIAAGVPAVELHGNLAQNARNRNLAQFSDGSAATLVATDIAARGIHVDDVALVIHADPPVEHKAYLHRSGRTARAGAAGTVITLMTDDQQGDVRDLTRKAGIKPTTTRARPGDTVLAELAPGERTYRTAPPAAPERTDSGDAGRAGTGRRRGGRPRTGGTAGASSGSARATSAHSGAPRSGAAQRSGTAQRSGAAPRSGAAQRSGAPRSGASRTGSASVYSTSTGGAAAFSAGTRAGGRRGR
jgi:superfamily II DNA/RNA helicase